MLRSISRNHGIHGRHGIETEKSPRKDVPQPSNFPEHCCHIRAESVCARVRAVLWLLGMNMSKYIDDLAAVPNLLKVREDRDVVLLSDCADGKNFTLLSDSVLGDKDKDITVLEVRKRVEPWLTALCQSEHLSLLIGTGLTSAACYAASGGPVRGMETKPFVSNGTKIAAFAAESAKRAGRGKSNFEDEIRVANELARGLSILGKTKESEKLAKEIRKKLSELVTSLLINEAVLKKDEKGTAWKLVGNFLMSFATRSGGKDRLGLFTTNYDRVLEETADRVGLRFVDRFVGALEPIFRSSRLNVDYHYNPPGIKAEPRYLEGVVRYTKLHGSLDWFQSDERVRKVGIPFGAKSAEPYLDVAEISNKHEYLIYPNSSKDRDTAEYPYVDLFRDFAASICQPNSTLFTYGYGFGDSHINRIIEDSLSIASTHLVIISYDQADGRVTSFYEKNRAKSQISLLIGKDLADLANLVNYYLPKPAIDVAMWRMAKVVESRAALEKSGGSRLKPTASELSGNDF